jgi:hypothetical protein
MEETQAAAPRQRVVPPGRPVTTRFPELAGVAEVAALASEHYGRPVSRARANELTRHDLFPEPVAELQMGRVWLESAVKEFLAIPRPPGRPRSAAPSEPAPAGDEQS